jgi:hypothetical protein
MIVPIYAKVSYNSVDLCCDFLEDLTNHNKGLNHSFGKNWILSIIPTLCKGLYKYLHYLAKLVK